jgi:hypothetical protein
MKEIPDFHEQVFVSTLLSGINGKASSILDSFSGWLIGGFGATSALFVSQYDSIATHLNQSKIHDFLFLFLWALGTGIIQKYLSVIITANSLGAEEGRKMGEKAVEKSIKLNFEIILCQMAKPIFPGIRWLVTRTFTKVKNGDLVSNSQNYTRLLQIQSFCVFIQAALTLIAIYKVASAFHA